MLNKDKKRLKVLKTNCLDFLLDIIADAHFYTFIQNLTINVIKKTLPRS